MHMVAVIWWPQSYGVLDNNGANTLLKIQIFLFFFMLAKTKGNVCRLFCMWEAVSVVS